MMFEQVIVIDVWGEQVWLFNILCLGESGIVVIVLWNCLICMGYLFCFLMLIYDDVMVEVVCDFQNVYGFIVDGVVGLGMLEQINIVFEEWLKLVLVVLECECWLNIDCGDCYVWVNLIDFMVKIVDYDIVIFEICLVIGVCDRDC